MMTGPAYVAYIPVDHYLPRCHHHKKVWSGVQTDDLTAAIEASSVHNHAEHADLLGTTSPDASKGAKA